MTDTSLLAPAPPLRRGATPTGRIVRPSTLRRTRRSPAGRLIHQARRAQGVRVKDLAAAAGVGESHASNMLTDRERLTADFAFACERLLGLDAEALIRLEHEHLLAKPLARLAKLRSAAS